MPASLPGDNDLNNGGNPNAGRFVIMDPFSGPKGSILDAKMANPSGGGVYVANPGGLSTGGLSTGIGFGSPAIVGVSPDSIAGRGFNDDYIPGVTKNSQAGMVASADSTLMYIGGGRSIVTAGMHPPGVAGTNPYTAGFAICGAGNGGSRDSGANTGFPLKMVTATGNVANGAAIEAGSINRSGVAMIAGQSTFGSAVAANAAPV